ncbi:Uncharacterised protein [Mycobacteroides abscessus subsp. abscessus]|nr:Uncharacterised protein [Mycobacteroides abscessus subsp. abscessus]
MSSSSTTGNSGLREFRMNCHQLAPPFSGLDSTNAVRKLYPSSAIATPKMTIATMGDWRCSGAWIL